VTSRRAPKCPYDLGPAGTAWWKWAHKTPQAKHWDVGAQYIAARRALLEDDNAALTLSGDDDLLEQLLEGAAPSAIAAVTYALQRLAQSAAKTTGLSREMRELENQLGLTPKSAAALGWKADEPEKTADPLDQLAAARAARLAAGGTGT
jgi:hypothetical protein